MPQIVTRQELIAQLKDHLEENADDERLAWLGTMFLDGSYRVVGDGIFEKLAPSRLKNRATKGQS